MFSSDSSKENCKGFTYGNCFGYELQDEIQDFQPKFLALQLESMEAIR
jgi:hypothetical protein